MSADYDKLKLKDVAERISAHLKNMEADPKINLDRSGNGLRTYFLTGAYEAGSRVKVCYISYQGSTSLKKAQAIEYLKALDSGYRGRHFELFRKEKS